MSGDDLQSWVASVSAALALTAQDCDVDTVLDLARDAAHAVMRPAAPLTTYLVGVAVGRGVPLEEAVALAAGQALRWSASRPDEGSSALPSN